MGTDGLVVALVNSIQMVSLSMCLIPNPIAGLQIWWSPLLIEPIVSPERLIKSKVSPLVRATTKLPGHAAWLGLRTGVWFCTLLIVQL